MTRADMDFKNKLFNEVFVMFGRMKIVTAFLFTVAFAGSSLAQDNSGFSVGGTGSFEGEAAGNFQSFGYADITDYVNAAQQGYPETKEGAETWNEAKSADDGSQAATPLSTAPAGCASPSTYGTLNNACTGSSCTTMSYGDFGPVLAFNQANPCITPSYTNIADYQAASALGYSFVGSHVTQWNEAKGGSNNTACGIDHPGKACNALSYAEYGLVQNNVSSCNTAGYGSYQDCTDAFNVGYGRNSASYTAWTAAYNDTAHHAFCLVEAGLDSSVANGCAKVTSVQYLAAKAAANIAVPLDFTNTFANATLWKEAAGGSLNAECNAAHSTDCDGVTLAQYQAIKTDAPLCTSAGFTSYASCLAAKALGYAVASADATLWGEANGSTYDSACTASHPGKTCSDLTKVQYQAAKAVASAASTAVSDIASAISGGGTITSSDVSAVLASTGGTVDADVSLSNPLHLSFIQDCIGSNATAANVESCSTNVDGTALNKHVVSEIAGGATGTITSSMLQNAGVSSVVAGIAAGNTCGANNDQSCVAQITAALSSASSVTTATIENALVTYFDGQVTSSDTALPTSNLTTGCTGSAQNFQVPNPPPLCATVHWNCASNTNGISVVYNDQGKGNIVADSSVFTGSSYSVTATLTVGSTTRTRNISGSFNVQTAIAGAQQGYKTTSEPAWWRNYNALHRARDRCAAWGGSIATHADIVAANNALPSDIITNGTRTIFATSSGDANVSTGGKTQCSESWPTQHTLKWVSGAKSQRCNNVSGFGRNFTILCKDVPSC